MADFNYYHSIEVRYGDLDPQGHVNNATYLTYLEQGRVGYIRHLNLWQGGSFMDFGIILADAHISYQAPILFGQQIRVGVRTQRLGNKSITMEYCLEDTQTGQIKASATTVLVTYDYHTSTTIPIPTHWRETIMAFDRLALS